MGAELYVVAVGKTVNMTELTEIASKPTSKYLHRYNKFGSIRLSSLDIGDDVECGESFVIQIWLRSRISYRFLILVKQKLV